METKIPDTILKQTAVGVYRCEQTLIDTYDQVASGGKKTNYSA